MEGMLPRRASTRHAKLWGTQKTEDGHSVPDSPKPMIGSQILFLLLSMHDLTERFQRREKAVVRVWGCWRQSRGAVSKGPWTRSVT